MVAVRPTAAAMGGRYDLAEGSREEGRAGVVYCDFYFVCGEGESNEKMERKKPCQKNRKCTPNLRFRGKSSVRVSPDRVPQRNFCPILSDGRTVYFKKPASRSFSQLDRFTEL